MDFFVSYTSADRQWAEWIAWQLEAEGYQVVVQAWDFGAGSDWAHEMQRSTSAAARLIAVLSPDSVSSAHAEAEWRIFYAKDPSGELGLLLPVRVRPVDLSGLLETRVYVDLVGRDGDSARKALLAAARGSRGRPDQEPEFPGGRRPVGGRGGAAPQFPGVPTTGGGGALFGSSVESVRADDLGGIRDFADKTIISLRADGFSESDLVAFRISLLELVNNVAVHGRGSPEVNLTVSRVGRSQYLFEYVNLDHLEGLKLEVEDGSGAFDFEGALLRSEAELARRGVEHGLLRAYRHGSLLHQMSTEPHVMGWLKERTPQVVPAVFGGDQVIPFIFSYRQESIRIRQNVHTFLQFQNYCRRSDAFMDLIFDPLQRPARRYVGIEITGHSWSGSLYWRDALDPLLSFVERNARFDKQLLLFADVDPSEQRGLREYCAEAGIVMFEDESEIRDLDESTIRARGRPVVPNRRATDAVRATGREERRRSKRRWFRRD